MPTSRCCCRPTPRAGAWSKWFLKPFLWGAAKTGMLGAIRDLEVRQKLSLFVRSRWFRPPLDGRIMAGLMYDAVTSMGEPRAAERSRCCRPVTRSTCS